MGGRFLLGGAKLTSLWLAMRLGAAVEAGRMFSVGVRGRALRVSKNGPQ